MALTEDGTNLPKDSGNRRFSAGYNAAGGLRAPRLSDTEYHTITQDEKGTPTSTRVSVGPTSTLLLAANPLRRRAKFRNYDTNSGSTVYLKPGTGATTSDYPLPSGAAEFPDDHGQTAWYAISESGTVRINVVEWSG